MDPIQGPIWGATPYWCFSLYLHITKYPILDPVLGSKNHPELASSSGLFHFLCTLPYADTAPSMILHCHLTNFLLLFLLNVIQPLLRQCKQFGAALQGQFKLYAIPTYASSLLQSSSSCSWLSSLIVLEFMLPVNN